MHGRLPVPEHASHLDMNVARTAGASHHLLLNSGSNREWPRLCGTTHTTVRRVMEAHQAARRREPTARQVERGRNYESVA